MTQPSQPMADAPIPPAGVARRLSGRIGLVTGAAGDIGRAIALRIAAEGATVILTDLPAAADGLGSVAQACQDLGVDALVRPVDVTDEAAVAAMVDDVAATIGPPDAIVTSAGVQGAFTPLTDYPVDDLRTVLEVNVVGTFTVIQACAAALRARGVPGSVVAVSSIAGCP
jgi:NAD(P)-dependent dehydrogenase (short-subunit alcohol dehydrogenase family)